MTKTILITGATDGIGLETAKKLAAHGHTLLLHGRNAEKLEKASQKIAVDSDAGTLTTYVADLAKIADVEALASDVAANHDRLDVLINNAGILKTSDPITEDGFDVRLVVNTLAPYLLTKRLLPLLGPSSRVVNVSSAAQAPVNLAALTSGTRLDDMAAYSQSKLAITMWSNALARSLTDGPVMIAVNPGSLLASKMVREGFGIDGNDLSIGADILSRAALSDEFADANGKYYDNDAGRFGSPHTDALNHEKCGDLVQSIEQMLGTLSKGAKT
nr:SDR family NAD(P)-dependent oxidoreductase [Hyphomicrobiales bacterium]